MSAEEIISITTSGHSDAIEQPKKAPRPRKKEGRTVALGIVMMIFLTAGLVLHTFCLATPNLAKAQFRTSYGRLYHFPFQTHYTSDISIGLWKICSRDWPFDCIDWPSRTKMENVSGITPAVSYEKPEWLNVAQNTSVFGLAVAIITEAMVVVNMYTFFCCHCKFRLFPVVICIGALAGGCLVFISCAFVALNSDSLYKFVAVLVREVSPIEMTQWSSSTCWGYYLDVSSVILMWMAGLLILCNHRPAGKVYGMQDRN